jgi:hypothetical protein
MPSRNIRRGSAILGAAGPAVAPIYVDSDDNILKFVPAGSGSTEVQILDASSAQTLTNKTLTSPALTSAVLTSPTITTGITPTSSDGAGLGTGTLMFADLFLASGGVVNFNNGNVTLTHAAGKLTMAVPAPTGSINAFEVTMTSGSATPGTIRSLVGSATSYTTMTSGNMVGARGQATLGGNISGTAFVYGAQGKVIGGANSIAVGSSMVYGVMGQLDLTGTTVTNGYVAGVGSDIFGVASGTVACDLFYGQHAAGGTINSYLHCYGKSTYAFEFWTNSGTAITSVSAGSAASLWVRMRVDGTAYKIALLADS